MNSGKVPVNVLKRSVLRQLKNKRTEIANSAGLGADCAVFAPFSEGQLVTCVQEGVVELQCENDLAEAEREDLSVMPMRRIFQKCANNLAAAGAEPVAAELVIFLPETVEEPELKALMEEAERAATDLNIQIIGGQTRVSSAVRQPIATATGYGILSEAAVTQVSEWKKLAGQDIIITKWIGLEGTADLAARNQEELLTRYPEYLVEEAVRSGITDILIILGRNQSIIEDHFDRSPELEEKLAAPGKEKMLEECLGISNLANIFFVRQKQTLGLGHAVSMAKPFTGVQFRQAVQMAAACCRRLDYLRQENDKLRDKIAQIRLVDRAKCYLIEHKGMSEAEAHRMIEKTAMDTRRDRAEVAAEILEEE